MQIDMHFYGVYALARAAGLKDETARTVAYASQFVDDAIEDDVVVISNEKCVIPSMTSHKPLDYQNALPGDQWKVWVPFHFLPGNESDSGYFVERMVCRKNSKVARALCTHALDPKNKDLWPHLIGIAAHVYADTFSHYGFVGFSHAWNKVKSNTIKPKPRESSILHYIIGKFEQFKTRVASGAAELIPVGHGAVATYPDRPYLEWKYEYESHQEDQVIRRKNSKDFLEGAENLFKFFSQFAEASPRDKDPAGARKWGKINGAVQEIIEYEGPKDNRVKQWKRALLKGVFSNVSDTDQYIRYDETAWEVRDLRFYDEDIERIKQKDPFKFIQAAKHHRIYVLQELLPEFGLVIN
jgi:hypothetical protein